MKLSIFFRGWTYQKPSSFFDKKRTRSCLALSTLHSADYNHNYRFMLSDVDCQEQGKYACTYNPDFMGFHFVSDITYEGLVDVTFGAMSATTCLAYCKSTVEQSVLAILVGERCICSKGSPSYAIPKFKVKNKVSGKYLTATAVDGPLEVQAATGADDQLW